MQTQIVRGLAAALLSLSLLPTVVRADNEPFARRSPVVEAVQKTKTSIVCIRVPRPGGGKDMIGSGVLVDARGVIVTNRHVVGANRHVTVCLHDGTKLPAEVVTADPSCDLAVLRVRTSRALPFLALAPINDLMVGETVIAIGNPFGYTNTVSTGIISALGREIEMPTQDVLTGLIQITAAINPGNSGGALLNINGELIGINVALRDGAQNIAFAINADSVKAFLGKHLSAAKVSGINHGLHCREKVLGETGDRQRVLIAGTEPLPGLKSGDELRALAGLKVGNAFDVERALWGKKPGEQVALQIFRQGREINLTLTLAAGQGAGLVADLGPMPAPPASATIHATTSVPVSDPR